DFVSLDDARAAEIKELMQKHNVAISSLAWYTNMTDPAKREENTKFFRLLIDAADKLDVKVVCTLAGMPVEGKDKIKTIEEDCAAVFTPLVEYAASKGVKIALENWFATCLQGLAHFDRMFQIIPHENFGLNFDPSHLVHQQIDYIAAVERYANRIFHTHAKDTEIRDDKLRYLGNQMGGWWRYVIPGFGRVRWGEYIACLRRNGYNGVLSIEHEDSAVGREEGFIKGKNFLELFA
ncbi:MAG: sugar phosphate isomerase/epimerase, partial [Armatimonadota bacterium]|nr:sugar phosphate isomerase/epimerase [Armatimonadota bacterium]